MRSFVRFATALTVPIVLAGTIAVGACDASDQTAAFNDANSKNSDQSNVPSGNGGALSSGKDASASVPPEMRHGLCNAGTCTPDHTGEEGSDGCVISPDAGANTQLQGCHLKDDKGTFVPKCEGADSRGVDGVSCTTSVDCAPGFDCVEGDKGPVCRRYCCSGSCEGQLSANSGSTFCDVGKLASPDQHIIPVCMPVKTCKLLAAGECGDKETCAVVTEKGETSCVPKGDAKVGDPCDDTHCDSDLNCLGSPGDRHCYKLCRVDQAGDCAPMETCTTGAVFPDTAYGVCKSS